MQLLLFNESIGKKLVLVFQLKLPVVVIYRSGEFHFKLSETRSRLAAKTTSLSRLKDFTYINITHLPEDWALVSCSRVSARGLFLSCTFSLLDSLDSCESLGARLSDHISPVDQIFFYTLRMFNILLVIIWSDWTQNLTLTQLCIFLHRKRNRDWGGSLLGETCNLSKRNQSSRTVCLRYSVSNFTSAH